MAAPLRLTATERQDCLRHYHRRLRVIPPSRITNGVDGGDDTTAATTTFRSDDAIVPISNATGGFLIVGQKKNALHTVHAVYINLHQYLKTIFDSLVISHQIIAQT